MADERSELSDVGTPPPAIEGLDQAATPAQTMLSAPTPNIEMAPAYTDASQVDTTAPLAPGAKPPQPVPANVPHARLLNMLQALSVGVGAFGRSIATGGKEGGIAEVTQYQQQQVENALRQKQEKRMETEAADRHDLQAAQIHIENMRVHILEAEMPAEIQLKYAQANQAFMGMLEKAGVPGIAMIPMIMGQGTQEHVDSAMGKVPDGNISRVAAVSAQPNGYGKGGSTQLYDLSQMDKPIPADLTKGWLSAEQQWLDSQAKIVGADNKQIQSAQAELAHMQKDMTSITGRNAWMWQVGFHSRVAQATAQQAEMEKRTKEIADTEKAQHEADPVYKLSQPEELAKPGTPAALQAMINDPKTKPGDIPRLRALQARAGEAQNNVLLQKEREERQKQAIAQGSPDEAGKMLANYSMTIEELKNRAVTPDFVVKAVQAAQKYRPGFSAPESAGQAAVARSAQNQQFFGNADSLLVRGGTLDQLHGASNAIGSLGTPIINTPALLLERAAGSGPIAAYAASILGVADDYAKVMGGAIGTDSARQIILDRLNAAQSMRAREAVINQFRYQIRSQREGRIGTNPYLKNMYPVPQQSEQAQKPPAGAKGQIPGSDGKMYWSSDGKTGDLGLVQ